MAGPWLAHSRGTGSRASVGGMSEHDNTDPVEADPVEPVPVEPDPAVAHQPAAEAQPRWRDRLFRMRAVAAVAVAGVILGAAGGSITTALVSSDDHGHHDEHFRMGQFGPPGVPAVPPGGRSGSRATEGGLPDPPVPPGTDDGTDGGTDEPSSLSQS